MKKIFFFFFFLLPSFLGADICMSIAPEALKEHVLFSHASMDHLPSRGSYPNQDRSLIASIGEFVVMAVFDGHGSNGHHVSSLVRLNLTKSLIELIEQEEEEYGSVRSMKNLLKEAFSQTQDSLFNVAEAWRSGSTAIVAVLNTNTRHLYVANVGDSRAIVVRDHFIIYGSKDQVSSNQSELDRYVIQETKVLEGFPDCFGVMRLQGSLMPSRSMGDFYILGELSEEYDASLVNSARKKFGMPQIDEVKIEPGDRIVLASDGLWDVINNNEVARFSIFFPEDEKKEADLDTIDDGGFETLAQKLVNEARHGFFDEDNEVPRKSEDDIAVLVVQVK